MYFNHVLLFPVIHYFCKSSTKKDVGPPVEVKCGKLKLKYYKMSIEPKWSFAEIYYGRKQVDLLKLDSGTTTSNVCESIVLVDEKQLKLGYHISADNKEAGVKDYEVHDYKASPNKQL